MAHTLDIIQVTPAGAETTIVSMGATLLSYELQALPASELLANPEAQVTERAAYLATPASVAALLTVVRNIRTGQALAARRQQARTGNRYYVKFQPDGAAAAYRSEILDGNVPVSEENLDYQWPALKIEVAVFWTRRGYWEAASETELSLANGGGSGTGGRTVYNHDDGGAGHDDYVQIAAADVTGDLPAPCRVEMANASGAGVGFQQVHLGLNAFSGPTVFVPTLEYESGNLSGTDTADANSSNGFYVPQTIAASELWSKLATWSLSAAQIDAAAGGWFRLLARLLNVPTGMRVQPRVEYAITDIWTGEEVYLDATTTAKMYDFGWIQIPPGGYDQGSMAALSLSLYGRAAAGGTFSADFLKLFPLDGWRRIGQVSNYSIPNGDKIVDDGIYKQVYGITGSSRYQIYTWRGPGISLWPGRDQRILFAWAETVWTISQTLTVRAYYRPRVASL